MGGRENPLLFLHFFGLFLMLMDHKAMRMHPPPSEEQAIAGATLPARHGTPGASGPSRSLRCSLEPENKVHRGGRHWQSLKSLALAGSGPF